MIQVITSEKTFEFTDEEWNYIKILLRLALEFEIDSYSLFEELAIANDIESIEGAMKEIVQDGRERELIIKLHTDKEFIEKIKDFYK